VDTGGLQAFVTNALPTYTKEATQGLGKGLENAVLWYLASFREWVYREDCFLNAFLAVETLARAHSERSGSDAIMERGAFRALQRELSRVIDAAMPACDGQRSAVKEKLGELNRRSVTSLIIEMLHARGIHGYPEREIRQWCRARNDIAHRATSKLLTDDPVHGSGPYVLLRGTLLGCLERLLLVILLPEDLRLIVHPSAGGACLQSDPPFRAGGMRWKLPNTQGEQ